MKKKVLFLFSAFFVLLLIVSCSSNSGKNEDSPYVSISATVNKAEYNVGDKFSGSDLKVTAKKLDGTIENLSYKESDGKIEDKTFSVKGFNSETAGDKVVTVVSTPLDTLAQLKIVDVPKDVQYKVTYTNTFGLSIPTQNINSGSKLVKPATNPTKTGEVFVGWYIKEIDHMWDYLNDRVISDVELTAKYVYLDAKHLLMDAYKAEGETNPYIFKTLDDLKESNKMGDNVTVYFAPGVYWTDDYTDETPASPTHNGLTGITFNHSNMVFRGLTSNADDVRICGNRGQQMGSNGNWNVIGVGRNFRAFDLTVANYCSFDLVYPRDPSQNLVRRGDARMQAQTFTGGGGQVYMRNVRVMSFLNLMAGFYADQGYFQDCYFQLTDDAIMGGTMNVYENCEFDFYGNHPSGGGSSNQAVFLGCTFNGKNDPSNDTMYFSKSAMGTFVVIDSIFTGNIKTVEWENTQRPNAIHYVYNNKFEDGSAVPFTPNSEGTTVELVKGGTLDIYKEGDKYNISNLLNFTPNEENPVSQAYKVSLSANKSTLESEDPTNEVVIRVSSLPADIYTFDQYLFKYEEDFFNLVESTDGKLHLNAKINKTKIRIITYVYVTSPNGLVSRVQITINPETVDSPVITDEKLDVTKDIIKLTYTVDFETYNDHSNIKWYQGSTAGAKDRLVAITTLNNPYLNYKIQLSDVGKFITAVITPKYEFSLIAENDVTVSTSRVIAATDITNSTAISTDFSHITWEGNQISDQDYWYADVNKPADCSHENWQPSTNNPWSYVLGDRDGAKDKLGLLLQQRGSRLTYTPSHTGNVTDFNLSLDYSSEKSAGQGFGGATTQYLEVYFKFDHVTKNGYALRIERTTKDREGNAIPSSGCATRWTLLEYVDGVANIFDFEGNDEMYSGYLPDSNITISVVGNTIKVDGTTKTEQSATQAGFNIDHEIHFEYTLSKAANNLAGFGFQFTTTSSAGNRTMLHNLDVSYKLKEE